MIAVDARTYVETSQFVFCMIMTICWAIDKLSPTMCTRYYKLERHSFMAIYTRRKQKNQENQTRKPIELLYYFVYMNANTLTVRRSRVGSFMDTVLGQAPELPDYWV